jgi:hypothetical protein
METITAFAVETRLSEPPNPVGVWTSRWNRLGRRWPRGSNVVPCAGHRRRWRERAPDGGFQPRVGGSDHAVRVAERRPPLNIGPQIGPKRRRERASIPTPCSAAAASSADSSTQSSGRSSDNAELLGHAATSPSGQLSGHKSPTACGFARYPCGTYSPCRCGRIWLYSAIFCAVEPFLGAGDPGVEPGVAVLETAMRPVSAVTGALRVGISPGGRSARSVGVAQAHVAFETVQGFSDAGTGVAEHGAQCAPSDAVLVVK